MTLVALTGRGPFVPGLWADSPQSTPAFAAFGPIDATGEKLAMSGRFWHPDRTSKNISRVQFRFRTVTKAGGSGLTVSLQNVSTAAGPPLQPDETQDQTVAIANGDASFASNTWYRTGTLSASRTVSHGELLSVVIEYDGSGRLGSDSVELSVVNNRNLSNIAGYTTVAAIKTASWAASYAQPNLILECDDGTFGTLESATAASEFSELALQSDTSPDEVAFGFVCPAAMAIDALYAVMQTSNTGATFDLVLYDSGGTPLDTVSFNPRNAWQNSLTPQAAVGTLPGHRTLTKDQTYYVAIKPTQSTQDVTIGYLDVNAAGHLNAMQLGISGSWYQRTDAGEWNNTATRLPLLGFRISKIDDGAGGVGITIPCLQTNIIGGRLGVAAY